MRKFILIDNSITDTSGHYYQYAVHCLRAAEEAGYTPILATNIKYRDLKSLPWKIVPAYKYGFWSISDKRVTTVVKLYHGMLRRLLPLKYSAIFSWIGFSWFTRHQFSDYMRARIPTEESMKVPVMWLFLSSLLVPIFLAALRIRSNLRDFKKSLFYSILYSKPIDPVTGTPFESERSESFCEDTKNLFRHISLDDGDIVFIPTVGTVEMLGLLEYFRKDRGSKNASWHLLFRRNIYNSRENEYWKEDEKLRPLRGALFHFIQSLEGQKAYFYTDSDELTTQYNRLAAAKFRTLPIPHTRPPHATESNNGPLLITYIGNARTEKGYHHLPHIVDDLWSEYVKTGKVRFAFQSDLNISGGEPKVVVALSQLEHFPKDKVQLIYNPLSPEEYEKLLLSSNIVLLPYEPDHYYARSSGILAESLAVGIPVIVPAGTWMAGQFIREIYRYHSTLHQRLKIIESYHDSDLPLHVRGHPETEALINGEITFGGESTKVYCWLRRPSAATHILISLDIEARSRTGVTIDVAQLKYDRTQLKYNTSLVEKVDSEIASSVFIPLERDADILYIAFKNPYGNDAVHASKINVTYLSTDQVGKCPLSAVGIAYNNPDEISDLLREIIDNYHHYRETALK
ncbi:MAG: hypothetical protein ACRD32_04580, partial [Nitrososphaerales archaeon]